MGPWHTDIPKLQTESFSSGPVFASIASSAQWVRHSFSKSLPSTCEAEALGTVNKALSSTDRMALLLNHTSLTSWPGCSLKFTERMKSTSQFCSPDQPIYAFIYLANVFENLVCVRLDLRQWSEINEQNRQSPCPGGGPFSQPIGSNKQTKPSLQQTASELEEN